jgi:hypothetical protein
MANRRERDSRCENEDELCRAHREILIRFDESAVATTHNPLYPVSPAHYGVALLYEKTDGGSGLVVTHGDPLSP